MVKLHLLKTIENQDFEMTLISGDNKELLQMWHQLDGCVHLPYHGLQTTDSHISRFKVWNKIYISFKIELIDGGEGLIKAMALLYTTVSEINFFIHVIIVIAHVFNLFYLADSCV
jgi:hypothetical protein